MNFSIIHKQVIAQDIKRIDILSPQIANMALPGQFVFVTVSQQMHAIQMCITDADPKRGSITLIVHETGRVTKALGDMAIGGKVFNIVGPLGKPAPIDKYGVVVCVATGIGAAQILPLCRALKKKGNKVIGIVGAKSKKNLMLESQMRVVCDELFITTNDGSYERKGLATQLLQEMFLKYNVNAVYAIGSVDMMQAAVVMSKDKRISIYVTITPPMTNGLGICGSCRLKLFSGFQLACVDGPTFNGYDVDFNDLQIRLHSSKESGWDGLNPQHKAPKKELPIFVKSIWGSPKK